MTTIYRILLPIIVLVVMSDCEIKDPENETHTLFPYTVGNEWIYDESMDGSGSGETRYVVQSKQQLPYFGQSEEVYEVVKSHRDSGGSWEQVGKVFFSIRRAGLYQAVVNAEETEITSLHHVALYPAAAGEEWEFEDPFSDGTVSCQCVSLDEPVNTPSGTYDAVKYQLQYPGGTISTTYYAMDVGVVRTRVSNGETVLEALTEVNF